MTESFSSQLPTAARRQGHTAVNANDWFLIADGLVQLMFKGQHLTRAIVLQ